MPLLVQSLRQENGALCLSVLERLETLTHDAPSIISEYVNSLLPELLRLAGDKPSMVSGMETLTAYQVCFYADIYF